MTDAFFYNQLLFIGVTLACLIVPGYLFLHAFFHTKQFAPLEKCVLSVPLSFALITIAIMIMGAWRIPLDYTHYVIMLCVVCAVLGVGTFIRKKAPQRDTQHLFSFSHTQTLLIMAIIVCTVVFKGMFLLQTIFPTATDLGHHLFWVEKIAREHTLPHYEKMKIITDDADNITFVTEPIADFIIGEHLFLAMIKTLTHQEIISAFPSLFLFVIQLFGLLMIFVITRRFFAGYVHGDMVAIMALLFVGPLWAISGAGAKFVSGGVIGNVIGNLFIPAIFYFLFRAFTAKKALFLIPAITLVTTIAYTHHLSTFIFGYSFVGSFIAFIVLVGRGTEYKKLFALLKNVYILPLLCIALGCLFVLFPPSYLNMDTIATSVGAPTKSTRTGVGLHEMMYTLGQPRFIFGMIGALTLSGLLLIMRVRPHRYAKKYRNIVTPYGGIFLIGWSGAIIAMSLFPHLLKVNILSTRIVTYGAFPLAILAAFAVVFLGGVCIRRTDKKLRIPHMALTTILCISVLYFFTTGVRDNATSMSTSPNITDALQTFHVATYTSIVFAKDTHDNTTQWMVKDHNYITADTWIKIFFADDYTQPLSRSYFNRYESHPNREKCTLHMISDPLSPAAQKCFDALNVRTVLVNTANDAAQFNASEQFSRIYQNDTLSVFLRNTR